MNFRNRTNEIDEMSDWRTTNPTYKELRVNYFRIGKI